MRSWAYAFSNQNRIRIFISKIIENRLPVYDFIFFLTVEYKERIRRHASQVAAGENSDTIEQRFAGEHSFEVMERTLKSLLDKHSKIEDEFTTSKITTNKIVDIMLNKILKQQ